MKVEGTAGFYSRPFRLPPSSFRLETQSPPTPLSQTNAATARTTIPTT